MSIAPLPATLEHLSGRPFAFYPPIRNIGGNEWLYRRATWTECIVANLRSGDEFSVPRMFVGEPSTVDEPEAGEPATIVELHRELEWRGGAIVPCRTRVIQLPVCVEEARDEEPHTTGRLAPVVSIRLETRTETPAGKWIGVALVLGVVACTIVADVAVQSRRRADPPVSRAWQQLSRDDDYRAVLTKLGTPARERSFDRNGSVVRVLAYPAMRFSVVLRGRSAAEARYAETIDLRGAALSRF